MSDEARRSANSRQQRIAVKRLTTGNRELDEILDGGIPENSINIIMGEPGSGKTTLAEEFVFANADDEQRPILYLTTLSEPLDKVIKYLQQFQFFDAEKMGRTVLYEGLGDELAANGVGALLPRLKDAIKTLSPKIIVIDSFKAIHDLAKSTQEMRLMLHEVGGTPRGVQHDRPPRRRVPARGHRDVSRVRGGGRDHRAGEERRSGRATSGTSACSSSAAAPTGQGFHAFDITADGLAGVSAPRQPGRGGLLQARRQPVLRRACPGSIPCSRAASGRGAPRSSPVPPAPERRRWAFNSSSRGSAGANGACWSISRRTPRSSRTRWSRSAEARRRRPRSIGAALLFGGRALHRQDRRQHLPGASAERDPPRGHRRARRPGRRRQRCHAHARLSLCAGAAFRGDGREQRAHARDGPTRSWPATRATVG